MNPFCPFHKAETKVLEEGVLCKQTHKNTFYCPVKNCYYLVNIYNPTFSSSEHLTRS